MFSGAHVITGCTAYMRASRSFQHKFFIYSTYFLRTIPLYSNRDELATGIIILTELALLKSFLMIKTLIISKKSPLVSYKPAKSTQISLLLSGCSIIQTVGISVIESVFECPIKKVPLFLIASVYSKTGLFFTFSLKLPPGCGTYISNSILMLESDSGPQTSDVSMVLLPEPVFPMATIILF